MNKRSIIPLYFSVLLLLWSLPLCSCTGPSGNECLHVAGDSKSENLISVSCTTDESYDVVTYCLECNEEMSRSTIVTKNKLGHTPSHPVQEYSASNQEYYYVTYCSTCSHELSREKFTHNQGLKYEFNAATDSYSVSDYIGNDFHISIPSKYNGKAVTGIYTACFRFKNITSVSIPSSIKQIGNRAFYGCPIETACVPAELCNYISSSSLKNVVINSGASIPYSALEDCAKLQTVVISDSVIEIGTSAFKKCTNLTEITIPNSVTSIGSEAFESCTNLKNILISNSVKSIGSAAFYRCTSLTNISIPDSVTFIGREAFSNCTNLKNIKISKNIQDKSYNGIAGIFSNTFKNCPIETATIPAIAALAMPATHLKDLKITNGAIEDYAFDEFRNLEEATICEEVTSIGCYAFRWCTNLESVNISNGVTSIDNCAFLYCNKLKQAFIPKSVIRIGKVCFSGCTNLQDIFYTGTEEQWNTLTHDLDIGLTNTTVHFNYR